MLNRLKNLFPAKGNGVAIELGSDRINIAQLQKKGADVSLKHLCSAEVPEGIFEEGRIVNPQELGDLVSRTLADNKIKATHVTTSVPMREAVIRLIPLPAELNDREVHDLILNQEAALYLPYPREEVDLDYQKLDLVTDEDGLDKVQVMLAATRREVTDSYIETFQYAGLPVKVLEISSFAVPADDQRATAPICASRSSCLDRISSLTVPKSRLSLMAFPNSIAPYRSVPINSKKLLTPP